MKKSIFSKTVIGLILALVASITLAIGMVGAVGPVNAPLDEMEYTSPKFKDLTVTNNTTVTMVLTVLNGIKVGSGDKFVSISAVDGRILVKNTGLIDPASASAPIKVQNVAGTYWLGIGANTIYANTILYLYSGSPNFKVQIGSDSTSNDLSVTGMIKNDKTGSLLKLADADGIDIESPIKNLAGANGVDPVKVDDDLVVTGNLKLAKAKISPTPDAAYPTEYVAINNEPANFAGIVIYSQSKPSVDIVNETAPLKIVNACDADAQCPYWLGLSYDKIYSYNPEQPLTIASSQNKVNIGTVATPNDLSVTGASTLKNTTVTGDLSINGGISRKGIIMDAFDKPMLTNSFDSFTSGGYSGVGRWGIFMEPHKLTFGIPNITNPVKYFVFKKFNADSTGTNLMTLSSTGILALTGDATVSGTFGVTGASTLTGDTSVGGQFSADSIFTTNITGKTITDGTCLQDPDGCWIGISPITVTGALKVGSAISNDSGAVTVGDDLNVTGNIKATNGLDKTAMFGIVDGTSFDLAAGTSNFPNLKYATCSNGYFPISCGLDSNSSYTYISKMYIDPANKRCAFMVRSTGAIGVTVYPKAYCLKGN